MKGYVWLLSSILGLFAMWPVMGLSSIFLLIPMKASLMLKKRFAFFFSSLLIDWFAIILMYFGGTKVFVHSKNPDLMKEQGNVIICNHRTRVDWMYAGWCFNMMTSNRNTKNHVILKEGLKKVPIFGWCMQLMMYTFLTRKKESDLPHIEKSIRCMRDTDPNSNILIFPEGTDMSDENIAKNDEFAAKNNLAKTKNVLYPKSLGLLTCISNWGNKNKSLIDITIIYKNHDDVKRASEVELMKG
jgi:lysocardiolipin and lysophospholipid acyltransferase